MNFQGEYEEGVEIEIPRRGDENFFSHSSLRSKYSVEIEIPRRGDENQVAIVFVSQSRLGRNRDTP